MSAIDEAKYIVAGAIFALLLYKLIGVALGTPMPVVAVLSDSMIPSIYPGDAVVICGWCKIHVGDVIVFDAAKKGCRDAYGRLITSPIIHRVIRINPDGTFETKGDHNLWQIKGCENEIPRKYVYGKAILKLPSLGWPKKMLTDLISFFIQGNNL